uniref:Uncharacterized protein n=1 Tax=Vespula pensylvanica TaxID=30213 RepID=A0A834N8J6_VESPE|nr:hypothetical protein H0235_015909 [Vespula pensylvanica]
MLEKETTTARTITCPPYAQQRLSKSNEKVGGNDGGGGDGVGGYSDGGRSGMALVGWWLSRWGSGGGRGRGDSSGGRESSDSVGGCEDGDGGGGTGGCSLKGGLRPISPSKTTQSR